MKSIGLYISIGGEICLNALLKRDRFTINNTEKLQLNTQRKHIYKLLAILCHNQRKLEDEANALGPHTHSRIDEYYEA